MMNELVPMVVMAIMTFGTYSIFELFVRRKERMAIIDKLHSGIDPQKLTHDLYSPFAGKKNTSSWALKIGLLFIGVGLGLLTGFLIEVNLTDSLNPALNSYAENIQNNINSSVQVIYFASISLFGGLGLLAAYFIEQSKDKKKD